MAGSELSIVEQMDTLSKAVLGMCAIMRTHPDLSAMAHMDLGHIHNSLIALRRSYEPPPSEADPGRPL